MGAPFGLPVIILYVDYQAFMCYVDCNRRSIRRPIHTPVHENASICCQQTHIRINAMMIQNDIPEFRHIAHPVAGLQMLSPYIL